MKDIGFDYKSTNQEGQNTRKSFVASEGQTEFKKQIEYQDSDKKSQHLVQHVHTQVRSLKNVTWRCHFYGRYGHIRPYCCRLYGYPHTQAQPHVLKGNNQHKKKWKPKEVIPSLIAYTSLRVSSKED